MSLGNALPWQLGVLLHLLNWGSALCRALASGRLADVTQSGDLKCPCAVQLLLFPAPPPLPRAWEEDGSHVEQSSPS